MAVESKDRAWWLEPSLLVEAFAIVNLGFLTCDIYLAHSVNQFRRTTQYIPLYFSAFAPIVLIAGLLMRNRWKIVWTDLGYLVGGLSIIVGFTGVILHLDSAFFYERTIRSLTYSAPFAAPLAYSGLGFLLVMNRMVEPNSEEWAKWVLLFTLGGFVGNFVFSLSDHAVNGFFNPMEWIAVWASAVGVGFLITPLLMQVTRKFVMLCAAILLIEAAVGGLGFFFHAMANLHGPSTQAWKNFVYGAPPFAPLLFPNLMLLGMIGLWRLREVAGRA